LPTGILEFLVLAFLQEHGLVVDLLRITVSGLGGVLQVTNNWMPSKLSRIMVTLHLSGPLTIDR